MLNKFNCFSSKRYTFNESNTPVDIPMRYSEASISIEISTDQATLALFYFDNYYRCKCRWI